MANRGRKPKPHALKLLGGTAKPGAEPEIALPLAEDGTPPNWLTEPDAIEVWDRLYHLLSGLGVLTEGDVDALAQLCDLQGQIIKARRIGGLPNSSLVQQLRTYYNEFGMTPASRGRVKAPGNSKASNPFAGLKTG